MPNAPRLVDYMTFFPQRCIITNFPNSENHGPVLDLGDELEEWGRVYVTESGARLVAEPFGFRDREHVESLNQQIADLHDQNAQLRAALDRVPATIEGFLGELQSRTAALVPALLGLAGDGELAVPAVDAEGDDSPAGRGDGDEDLAADLAG